MAENGAVQNELTLRQIVDGIAKLSLNPGY